MTAPAKLCGGLAAGLFVIALLVALTRSSSR